MALHVRRLFKKGKEPGTICILDNSCACKDFVEMLLEYLVMRSFPRSFHRRAGQHYLPVCTPRLLRLRGVLLTEPLLSLLVLQVLIYNLYTILVYKRLAPFDILFRTWLEPYTIPDSTDGWPPRTSSSAISLSVCILSLIVCLGAAAQCYHVTVM